MQVTTLLIILLCIIGFEFLLFLSYIMLTGPVAFPYINAKLKKGILLILKTESGKYVLVSTNQFYETKHYGDFLPNPEAVFHMCGVPTAMGYTGLAVPPSQDACDAAVKLQDAHAEIYTDLETTAKEAEKKGILEKRDVQALYQYAASVNPHYVNSRIERRVAEILARNRDNFSKLAGYAFLFVMVMIGAGVAIYMISTGSSDGVSAAVQSAATMNV